MIEDEGEGIDIIYQTSFFNKQMIEPRVVRDGTERKTLGTRARRRGEERRVRREIEGTSVPQQ